MENKKKKNLFLIDIENFKKSNNNTNYINLIKSLDIYFLHEENNLNLPVIFGAKGED